VRACVEALAWRHPDWLATVIEVGRGVKGMPPGSILAAAGLGSKRRELARGLWQRRCGVVARGLLARRPGVAGAVPAVDVLRVSCAELPVGSAGNGQEVIHGGRRHRRLPPGRPADLSI